MTNEQNSDTSEAVTTTPEQIYEMIFWHFRQLSPDRQRKILKVLHSMIGAEEPVTVTLTMTGSPELVGTAIASFIAEGASIEEIAQLRQDLFDQMPQISP